MAVTILDHHFESSEQVSAARIMDTIEKNRDRARVTANMLVTLSGIMISFSSGFVLFLVKDRAFENVSALLLVAAAVFLLTAILGISSTYLRVNYAILDETQFISDLLHRYTSELRLLRLATIAAVMGLLLIVAGMITLVHDRWGV